MLKALLISTLFLSGAAFGADFECSNSSNGYWCSYTGKITKTYVHETGLIKVQFESSFPSNLADQIRANFGSGVSLKQGAVRSTLSSDLFVKTIMTIGLTAQNSGRRVRLLLRDSIDNGSYMRIENISLLD